MKTRTLIISAIGVLLLLPTGCRTTEANYREAYEKTIAARQEQDSIESTIYGRERRRQQTKVISTPSGDVEVKTQFVKVTEGGGGLRENLHRYNVVAGQFKQLFNAQSLRERLVDAGYPAAFVVETAEPYYYIVVKSCDNVVEAQKTLEELKKNAPVAMKEPLPFILDATARR